MIRFTTEKQVEEFLGVLSYWFLKTNNHIYLIGVGNDTPKQFRRMEYATHTAHTFDELTELANQIWYNVKEQMASFGDTHHQWIHEWIEEHIHPIGVVQK